MVFRRRKKNITRTSLKETKNYFQMKKLLTWKYKKRFSVSPLSIYLIFLYFFLPAAVYSLYWFSFLYFYFISIKESFFSPFPLFLCFLSSILYFSVNPSISINWNFICYQIEQSISVTRLGIWIVINLLLNELMIDKNVVGGCMAVF